MSESGENEAHDAQADAAEPAALLRVGQVARLLNCSTKQVFRMVEAGRMPGPVRLGGLVRWRRALLMQWIGQGCPPCAGEQQHQQQGGEADR